MRILLWHGYLLGGTGSNVYTRQLAREWCACRARRDRAQPGGTARATTTSAVRRRCGPTSAGSCPSSCSTATRGTRCGGSPTARARSSNGGSRRTRRRCATCCPPTSCSRTTCCSAAPSAPPRGSRSPSRRTARSSSTRCGADRISVRGGGRRSSRRSATFVGSAHIREVLAEVCGPVPRVHEVPPGVDVDAVASREPRHRARGADRRGTARPAEPRESRGAPTGRGERRPAHVVPRRRHADGRVLRQADRAEGHRRPARGAARARRPCGDRRVRPRASGARVAGGVVRRPGALHRAARAPAPAAPARLRRRLRRAVGVPRGLRDGRRRGCGSRVPARRRAAFRARGGRGGAGGRAAARAWAAGQRSRRRTHRSFASGSRRSSPCRRPIARVCERRSGRSQRPAGAGPGSPSGCSSSRPRAAIRQGRLAFRARWANRTTTPYDRLLADARERFDAAEDFTVSVEEEFALLDPETLDLVNRFEDVQAAAAGHLARAEPRRRADRVGGGGEDRAAGVVRGRPRRARRAARRARCARRAPRPRARRDGHASLGELARPAHHRHAALPA